MGVLSNWIDRQELKPGDHIYSWREAYIYAHHGIYVGEGMVIHFTRGSQEIGTGTIFDRLILSSSRIHSPDNPCPNCGDQSRLHGVISSCLDCFLFGGNLYRFEYGVSRAFFIAKARGGTCTLASSDPPEDVLHRARYLLQNGFGVYDVSKNNCEDFALYCKTGLLVVTNISAGRSGQAASYSAAVNAVVSFPGSYWITGFCGWALAGCTRYCVNRLASDIGVRHDVAKVAVERLIDLSSFNGPANTNEAERLINPSLLDEPANTNKAERHINPSVLGEPANTNEAERHTNPSVLDEPANTNEAERHINPSGLDEPARANEVKVKND